MIFFGFVKAKLLPHLMGFSLLLVSSCIFAMQPRRLDQITNIPAKVRIGAGILPYFYDTQTGVAHVILGLERSMGWDYFGGLQDRTDCDALHTATREFYEETYRLISQREARSLRGYIMPRDSYTLFIAEINMRRFSPELLYHSYLQNRRTRLEHEEKIDFIAVPLADLINNSQNGVLPGNYDSASGRRFNGLTLRGGMRIFVRRALQNGTDQQRVFQAIMNHQAMSVNNDQQLSGSLNSDTNVAEVALLVSILGVSSYMIYKIWDRIKNYLS